MGDYVFIFLGSFCFIASIAFCIKSYVPPALLAYIGLVCLKLGNMLYVPKSILIFWGVATVLILMIDFLLRQQGKPVGNVGLSLFMTLGAIAGMQISLTIGLSYTSIGAWVGTILGHLAYGRTPNGKGVLFPASTFISYFCTTGLKIVITTSIIGIAFRIYLQQFLYFQ